MRDRTIIPTNLLDWPRISNLLPDLKLLMMALWASKDISCVGAGFLPIAPFAATVSLKQEALADGLRILQEAGLILLDAETGEVFICDWYRFHTFNSKQSEKYFRLALAKVRSDHIRKAISEKSKHCPPTAKATAITTAAAAKVKPAVKEMPTAPSSEAGDGVRSSVLRIENVQDQVLLDLLVEEFGLDTVEDRGRLCIASSMQPWMSNIAKILADEKRAAAAQAGLEVQRKTEQASAEFSQQRRQRISNARQLFEEMPLLKQQDIEEKFVAHTAVHNKPLYEAYANAGLKGSQMVEFTFYSWLADDFLNNGGCECH